MSGWKDAALSFGLVLGLSQVARFLDVSNPAILWSVRAIYALTTSAFYFILFYCHKEIIRQNDSKEISYVEKPSMLVDEGNGAVTIIATHCEYDSDELKKFARNSFLSVAISVFLHFKFGYLQPIFIQSVMPLKNLMSNPIVRIHLLKHPAEGVLRRPFKVSTNPFMGTADADVKKKPSKLRSKKN
ncbi:phosphate transporter (Pho88) [Entomophthora muscae]|nr:phosphate transporter (Pho88) [Entomophthora muscae]